MPKKGEEVMKKKCRYSIKPAYLLGKFYFDRFFIVDEEGAVIKNRKKLKVIIKGYASKLGLDIDFFQGATIER